MSGTWACKRLQDVFKSVVAGNKNNERMFGTHSGRKTFILNSLLSGKRSKSPEGHYQWSETNLDDLCQTARMTELTIKRYYVGKQALCKSFFF
jgi:hypothetical protein